MNTTTRQHHDAISRGFATTPRSRPARGFATRYGNLRRVGITLAMALVLTGCAATQSAMDAIMRAFETEPSETTTENEALTTLGWQDARIVAPTAPLQSVSYARSNKASSNSDEPSDRLDADANRVGSKGGYRKAERLYKEALVIAVINKGSNHPRVAEIRMALANLNYKQNKLAEAEQFYRDAIKILQSAYGDADHRYASALNNLAAVLYHQRRYSDAEALYDRALKIFRSELGPNHPHVGQTLTNLAKLYQARFEYGGAVCRETGRYAPSCW